MSLFLNLSLKLDTTATRTTINGQTIQLEHLFWSGKLITSRVILLLTRCRIYGGGFTSGTKDPFDPNHLIKVSQRNGGDGIVFVTMNYRLGAFGWSAGPTMEAAGAVPNAGLHDQRLAIQWVADNIHLFGGDPKKITIMGESAGDKSIILV
jgi:hypothetical protein